MQFVWDSKGKDWNNGCLSSVFGFFREREEYEATWFIDYKKLSDLKFVGAGSQGQIYSALLNDELVAVKKVGDVKETELRHLRKLKHNNIVQLRGICVEPPEYCIVMEFCQYGTLYSFIHSGVPLNPVSITRWFVSIASGMEYLHRNNIIHRDLKSLNILLGDDLVAKVSDFGTCCEWNSMLTKMKTFAGTVAWMAPEIIRNESYDEKIDVWSFGVVLWEMLTQEVPYKGMDSPAIIWGVGSGTISLPIPHSCPSGLRLLLSQCFSTNPAQRPSFPVIVNHLEIAKTEFLKLHDNEFTVVQTEWRNEVDSLMQELIAIVSAHENYNLERRRLLNDCRAMHREYEVNLGRANDIYLETCALRLHLEQREKAIKERELNHERCVCKRIPIRRKMRVPSSTDASNNVVSEEPRSLLVQLADSGADGVANNTVTTTVTNEDVKRMSAARTNRFKKIDTVVEFNGNVDGEFGILDAASEQGRVTTEV